MNAIDRTSSRKPTDELYATFKQNFPEVGPGTASPPTTTGPPASPAPLRDALMDPTMNSRYITPAILQSQMSFVSF